MKSFFISAGDPSGDLHASALIDRLKDFSENEISFTGLGGDNMISSGLNHLYHVKDLSATGYVEVLRKYSFFRKVLNTCSEFIINNKPDAVILVDYPGFNLRLASRIRKNYRGRIFYYISPQIWAWNAGRAATIKDTVDKMLVVFPFEVEFYKRFGIKAEYVGHPLTERLKKNLLNISDGSDAAETDTICILPGSRIHEIRNHMPVLAKTAGKLIRKYKSDIVFSKSVFINERNYKTVKIPSECKLSGENVYDLIKKSKVVLTKAGTSSLECALIGTPHLIFYKTSLINYVLLKPRAKIDFIGIANILSGRKIIKEFIQKDFTAENIVKEVDNILSDSDYRTDMKNNLAQLWNILGSKSASETSAKIILNSLK